MLMLCESVWKFMLLLIAKLDENEVPNLLKEQDVSPIFNNQLAGRHVKVPQIENNL